LENATPAADASGNGSGKGNFCGPAAKSFNWEHILSGHQQDGERASQSGKKTLFENMSESQIKAAVLTAWKNRELLKSQDNPLANLKRLKYQGLDAVSGYLIEFWFNTETCEVETAYPVDVNL